MKSINISPPYNKFSDLLSRIGVEFEFEILPEDDTMLKILGKYGEGNIVYREVIDGMGVVIASDLIVKNETILDFNPDSEIPAYAFLFYIDLGGNVILTSKESDKKRNVTDGAYMISSSISEKITFFPDRKTNFYCVFIFKEFVEKYLSEYFTNKELLNKSGKLEKDLILHLPSLSSQMLITLNDLKNNSFAGSLKKIFLESKVLELLALFFHALEYPYSKETKLKNKDLKLIHRAKEVLTADLESPPSVTELSRKVGLNEYKLRVGFKELFKDTIYGFLRKQRMIKAKTLLQNKDLTVSEVGYMVGYSNLSHFSEAFKKEFGITPSQINKD